MKTAQMRLLVVLACTVTLAWSLNSYAQMLYPPPFNPMPSNSLHGSDRYPIPADKYQYTIELVRIGGDFLEFIPLDPKKSEYHYEDALGSHIGIGFKDVRNGFGLAADLGGDVEHNGYWIRISTPFRVSSTSLFRYFYMQPSYKYRNMELAKPFRDITIAPHQIGIGPSFQFDTYHVAFQISIGNMAINFGKGLKEFEVTLANFNFVLQPIWF